MHVGSGGLGDAATIDHDQSTVADPGPRQYMLRDVVHRIVRHVEIDDRCVLEPHIRDVRMHEGNHLPLIPPALLVRNADQRFVELIAHASATESASYSEDHAAVAAAQVHKEAVLCEAFREHLWVQISEKVKMKVENTAKKRKHNILAF